MTEETLMNTCIVGDWRIRRESDGAVVVTKEGLGGVVVQPNHPDNNIAAEILHELAADLHTATRKPVFWLVSHQYGSYFRQFEPLEGEGRTVMPLYAFTPDAKTEIQQLRDENARLQGLMREAVRDCHGARAPFSAAFLAAAEPESKL